MEKGQGKTQIQRLIEKYEEVVRNAKTREYSEADVGTKFVLPILEALGWDIQNIDEVKEQKRTLSGAVDYSLRLNKKDVLLVEIKDFDVKDGLDGHYVIRGKKETFPEQATRYGWHLKVEWVVLTNFKELRLYNSYIKKPADGLRIEMKYNDYLRKFDELWQLSKERVRSGSLAILEARKERKNIDEEILDDLLIIRQSLTNNIRKNNLKLDAEQIKECVQKIMDRLLVVRVSEDRGILGFESLHKDLEAWKNRGLSTPFMRNLKGLFRDFDEIYNTKLFEEHFCEDLKIDNEILEDVVYTLYKYNFDLISSDVLGAIYEDYIGRVLRERGKNVEIVESLDARKKFGIYYTPSYVVDYIVSNTFGTLLARCKKPEDISKIKILDPACGSGSFLIKAFDIVKDWYDNYHKQNSGALFKQEVNYAKQILTQNLFGVDVDPQATEIASVNLMLKAIQRDEKLPEILYQNIKVGNSLISGSEDELKPYFGDAWKEKRPFNWHQEFNQIFANGGFDVIIGNPPYEVLIKSQTYSGLLQYLKEGHRNNYILKGEQPRQGYWSAEYNPNLFALFIERALELLKNGGILGFIIQKSLFTNVYFKNIRRLILERCLVKEIIDFRYGVFDEAVVDTVIIILEKEVDRTKRDSNKVKVHLNITNIEDITDPSKVVIFDQSFFNNPETDFRFQIHLEPKTLHIINKLNQLKGRIGQHVFINRGVGLVNPADRHKASLFQSHRTSNSDKPVFVGKDIGRYVTRRSQNWARIDNTTIVGGTRDPNVHEASEKIILPRIRNLKYKQRILASFDDKKIWVLDNYNILRMRDKKINPKFILALLNSKLLNFYFRNVFIDVNIKGQFIEQLPIPEIDLSSKEQKSFYNSIISSANRMLQLHSQLLDLNTDLVDYLKEPIIDYTTIRPIYNSLNAKDKKPADLETKGKIVDIKVRENDSWLIFSADCVKDDGSAIRDYEVVRMRISNIALRKFILGYLNKSKGRFLRGVLLSQILDRRIPVFHNDQKMNMDSINRQMAPYIDALEKYETLLSEIRTEEVTIDACVYKLYDITEKEKIIIESDSIQPETFEE